MAYLPKNRYKIKHTNGGELIKSNSEFYVGYYLELPNGYYAGNSLDNIGEELELYTPYYSNIPGTRENRVYSILNKRYVDKEKEYTTPVATKVYPTEENYKQRDRDWEY